MRKTKNPQPISKPKMTKEQLSEFINAALAKKK